MRVWRISAHPGLTGAGGRYDDGRWHSKGSAIIYAAEHPALAMVETMVHMRLALDTIPVVLKLIAIDVDPASPVARPVDVPVGWQANDVTSRKIGDQWLKEQASLVLPVPSAIVNHSTNYLINPSHPDASRYLTEGSVEHFWFDKRFL